MHRNQLSVFHLTIRFSKIGSMTIITLVVTMSTITTVAKKNHQRNYGLHGSHDIYYYKLEQNILKWSQ